MSLFLKTFYFPCGSYVAYLVLYLYFCSLGQVFEQAYEKQNKRLLITCKMKWDESSFPIVQSCHVILFLRNVPCIGNFSTNLHIWSLFLKCVWCSRFSKIAEKVVICISPITYTRKFIMLSDICRACYYHLYWLVLKSLCWVA